jgi:hypothetical protein
MPLYMITMTMTPDDHETRANETCASLSKHYTILTNESLCLADICTTIISHRQRWVISDIFYMPTPFCTYLGVQSDVCCASRLLGLVSYN